MLNLVQKWKNRRLAFIQDKKTIDVAREQYNSGVMEFYKRYVKDKELLLLIEVGFILKKLQNDVDRRLNLRNKIHQKHLARGLRIAEFVENDLLNKYVSILLDELVSINELENKIKEVLNNIDKHALFVEKDTKSSEIIKRVDIIINAHSPDIFIISGIKSAAETVRISTPNLKIILKGYDLEILSGSEKESLFFKRKIRP